MELVTDFLLLAATGTACLYCWILSKRLKRLTNAKNGFGAGIAALSHSAEEMKAVMESTKVSGDAVAHRLETLLIKSENRVSHLQDLLQQVTDMRESAMDETRQVTLKYTETLSPLIEEANESADRLFNALDAASAAELEMMCRPFGQDADKRPLKVAVNL